MFKLQLSEAPEGGFRCPITEVSFGSGYNTHVFRWEDDGRVNLYFRDWNGHNC